MSRLKRTPDPKEEVEREPRAAISAIERAKGRENSARITDEEREHLLREEAMSNSLPNPPPIPGMHLMWASTTNQYTPVQWYLRLGYEPVKPEEVPGMDHLKEHSGEFAGFVCCNEMVLMKIEEQAYQQIMKAYHHDKPNEEGERLRVNVELLKQEAGEDSKGNPLVREEGDGFSNVVDRRARRGSFE